MPNLNLPLSGAVTQTINPWTWLVNTVGGQFGLVNINLGKSSDPELEKEILDEVGTYGGQLGQMGDALNVLLNHEKLDDLDPAEKRAIEAFRFQFGEIARLKAKRLGKREARDPA